MDGYIIGVMVNLFQVLNPHLKDPANPLLRAGRPREGFIIYIYSSVLFDSDEECYQMF